MITIPKAHEVSFEHECYVSMLPYTDELLTIWKHNPYVFSGVFVVARHLPTGAVGDAVDDPIQYADEQAFLASEQYKQLQKAAVEDLEFWMKRHAEDKDK